jgi:protein Xni
VGERGLRSSRATVHLLLIDGLNLIRRVYAAQPGEDGVGRAEAARVASCQSLQRALRETSPTHAVVVLEEAGATWRHELFADYKAGHKPMPTALAAALPTYGESFAALGVRSFSFPATEADDVMATLAVKTAAAGGRATLLSTDRIFLQLVSPAIRLRDHFRKRDVERQDVVSRFGVAPEQWVDLMALAGESGNGVRGVPGIGLKTAARLIADYATLDTLLEAARTAPAAAPDLPVLPRRWASKLVTHTPEARLAQTLARLRTDLDLGLILRDLRLAER